MATLTLVRKSIYRLCSEAAYDQGLPFYQTIHKGILRYVLNNVEMTPGEAAKVLGIEGY